MARDPRDRYLCCTEWTLVALMTVPPFVPPHPEEKTLLLEDSTPLLLEDLTPIELE